jgi:outer membrane receptor protein involved in Fe transport
MTAASPIVTNADYTLSNTYLQAEWTPAEALALTFGVQSAEWRVTRVDQDMNSGRSNLPKNSLSGTTPRFALVWKPTALDILKVLLAQGYRNPTIFERYYADGFTFLNNPGLRPERIWTAEGIWIRIWGNGLQTQLAATQSRWTDQVYTADAGSNFLQARNAVDPIQGRALEAEVQDSWPGWELKGSVGLYRWERQGQRLDNAAPLEASLRLTHHLGSWSFTGEARRVGPRAAQGIDVPGATTARLAARWEGHTVWARVSVEDATDARRRDLVAREYAPITGLPGVGRTLRLDVGVRFP